MLVALLLVVQVGLVVRDALALAVAAREGAREAAVSADDTRATAAVRRSAGPLEVERIDVVIEPATEDRHRGEPVSVDLRYRVRIRIPVVDRIMRAELPLRARVTMRLERSAPEPTPVPSPTPDPAPEGP